MNKHTFFKPHINPLVTNKYFFKTFEYQFMCVLKPNDVDKEWEIVGVKEREREKEKGV